MALNKRTYTDGITVITAGNLNDIQDAIIALEGQDIPAPYNSNPEAPGEASPGTSDEFARGDHVHPLPPVDSALSDSSENPVQNKVVTAALDEKADAVEQTASGAAASFSDGADGVPVKDLTVAIEPVQSGSGDPSPDNVRPISGWTGANVQQGGMNLFNKADSDGYSGTLSDGGKTVTSQEVTNSGNINLFKLSLNKSVLVKNGERVYVSFDIKVTSGTLNAIYGIQLIDSGNNSLNSWRQGTVPSPSSNYQRVKVYLPITKTDIADYLYVQGNNGSAAVVEITNIMISNEPVYDYVPFTEAEIIHISWQSEAGTVYGGTLDVTTGKLTVDRAMVDLGTLTWEARYTEANNKTVLSHFPVLYPHVQTHNIIAENYKYYGAVSATTNLQHPDSLAVGLRSYYQSDYPQYDDIIYAVLPISDSPAGKVVYPLATPTVYDLTPTEVATLLGTNNIWADTGDSTVQYRADTKLYIAAVEDENRQLRLTIAPIEDGATASQAYEQGKYFFRNGSFCKAKTSIASGASFTLNTNYEVTTVAAELFTALNS